MMHSYANRQGGARAGLIPWCRLGDVCVRKTQAPIRGATCLTPYAWREMPRQRHHRRRRPDLDERFNLPSDLDPDDAIRRLLGVDGHPRPVESHEETEDPARDEDETPEA